MSTRRTRGRGRGRGQAAGAGLALIVLGVLAACVSSAERPPTRKSDAARINVQLGLGYLQQGNLAIAKEKLDRALLEDPDSADVHAALGLLDEKLGKVQDADHEYHRALSLAPQDPSMLNNYAVYLCSHGREVEGVRYFEQAAANPLYRTPWAAYTNSGVCLRSAHRDAEAAQHFARAQQSNPTYSEAVYQASDLDFSLQRNAQARLRIDLFLLNNPATPDLLLLAWRIAGAQQDAQSAAAYAARLQRDFPNSDQAHGLAARSANTG
jgi:type IV pilus assembly protein PilF